MTTTARVMKPTDDCQRIYVGGMNPPKLTVDMVLERIRQLSSSSNSTPPTIELIQVDDLRSHLRPCYEDSRSYFFITARSIIMPSDKKFPKETALDILSKLFHNVRWKGCTLQLHLAKPHFLERLALERLTLVTSAAEKEPTPSNLLHETNITHQQQGHRTIKSKIPRILKIRKRHAAEAFSVDTKPITIEPETSSSHIHYQIMEQEWGHSIQKQRLKRQKYQEKIQSKKKLENKTTTSSVYKDDNVSSIQHPPLSSMSQATFLNRSIHLRFYKLQDESETIHALESCTSKVQEYTDHPDSDENNNLIKKSCEMATVKIGRDYASKGLLIADGIYSSFDSEPFEDEREKVIKEKKKQTSTVIKGTYVWSDEESYDDDDISIDLSRGKLCGPSTMIGFLEDSRNAESRLLRLEDDVTSNMRILSSLFPTTMDSLALNNQHQKQHQEQQKKQELLVPKESKELMARDSISLLKSSESHENSVNTENEQQLTEHCAPNDTHRSSLKPITDQGNENLFDTVVGHESNNLTKLDVNDQQNDEPSSASHIYEQKKLEDIFAAGKSIAVPLFNFFTDSKDTQGDTSIENQKPPLTEQPRIFGINKDAERTSTLEKIDDTLDRGLESLSTRNLRSMCFPQDILDVYTRQFYSMNGGMDLMRLESCHNRGNENSISISSNWEEERKALTLDWKRKRKMALAHRRSNKFS